MVILRLAGLCKLKKSTSTGTQTGDLPACSIVLQTSTLMRAAMTPCNLLKKDVMKEYVAIFRVEK
jgi:hypothetical protein